jgi:hypothetical protein
MSKTVINGNEFSVKTQERALNNGQLTDGKLTTPPWDPSDGVWLSGRSGTATELTFEENNNSVQTSGKIASIVKAITSFL